MNTARAAGGFWGFDPEAPLDLGNLDLDAYESIATRLADKTMGALSEAIARVGNCSHPVRLRGYSHTFDAATGDLLDTFGSHTLPLGLLFKPCGNRRADVCPACSRTYARDTFEMVWTGVHGGKGVPETVADNPTLFVTLTAPSFGLVHSVRKTKSGSLLPCRPREKSGVCEHGVPLSCWAKHGDGDEQAGAPLCPGCYDTETAAVWQWFAPELWRRFTIDLGRGLAARLGISAKRLHEVAHVEYAKVAEYQARGAVHFHALIRLDGASGPGSPAPVAASVLEDAVRDAAASAWVAAPPVDADDTARLLRFGAELDVTPVRHGQVSGDELTDEEVAAYITKYATKSAGISPENPRPHLLTLAGTCRALCARSLAGCPHGCAIVAGKGRGKVCPDCKASRYGLLARWADMLGFRGHFSTKSHTYSVTLGKLRRARQRYQRLAADARRVGQVLDTRDLEARLVAEDDEETTLVVGSWEYQGTGWPRAGDKALADAAAARAREYAQWRSGRAA